MKLLIMGLDGATFQVIKPLCDEGKLPTLNSLIAGGTHGVLESTFPPVTGPAWTALATGKNPGKTGIFDSLIRTGGQSFATRLVSSRDIKRARPYWDYLSDHGIRTGVVNYPFLYPPYKLNGVMVSGLGSDPGDEIFYPREFRQQVLDKCGRYQIQVPWHSPRYAQDPPLFVNHLLELLEINEKTLELLLQSDLQALAFVISASDFAQHYMWRYIDRSHPYYQESEAEKYRPLFIQVWQRIDEILGSVMQKLSPEANIVIVSDHGFGSRRSAFYTGSWLEKEGYVRKKAWRVRARRLEEIAAKLVGKISLRLYRKLVLISMKPGRMPVVSVSSGINSARSLAFPLDNASLIGEICINRQLAGGDFETVRGEIMAKLEQTCRELGARVKVYSPSDLYSGGYLDLAPDILFDIEDGDCSIHFGFDRKFYQKPPSKPFHSGIHKKEGIFIAYGPDVRQGIQIEGTKIYDVAPTILHLLGLPVPDDMDGRVLGEIFREGSEPAHREIKYQKVDAAKEKVKDRVRKLREAGKL